MKTEPNDPVTMGVSLMLLSKEAVAAKCKELNIQPTGDKFKMIDKIIVSVFGLDACKKAFSRRSLREARGRTGVPQDLRPVECAEPTVAV